ncbi:LLM class flavin-dependent oxidoreductase [Nocardia sp. NPDC004711]
MGLKPFRFGVIATSASDVGQWSAMARQAESAGFSALVVPELPAPVPSPLAALAFAAAATTTLEVGTWVLANDFRNPVLLAREAATLDLLTGGRFRLGLGAGQTANGYAELGITAESGAVRIQRLTESVRILNALFRGEQIRTSGGHYRSDGAQLLPTPARKIPLLIAAGRRRATELAATEADTVAFSTFSREHLIRQIEWLETAAGQRFPDIELALRFSTTSSTVGPPMPEGAPTLLSDTPGEAADQLQVLREKFGITYVVLDEDAARRLAPTVRQLAGT